ncbi:MAG: hypothetical protein AAGF33_14295 [Pseudomonadota bacterium]
MGDSRKHALDEIRDERDRQIAEEGFDASHDDEHNRGELAIAASCYADAASYPEDLRRAFHLFPYRWPWQRTWWKPKTRREDLIRAGALIVAEIERLDREEDLKRLGRV